MTTVKQKLAVKKTLENGGNVSKAMKEAGYSKAMAKNPQKLTESLGWQELMEKELPDSNLIKVHKEGLSNNMPKDLKGLIEEVLSRHVHKMKYGTPAGLDREEAIDQLYQLIQKEKKAVVEDISQYVTNLEPTLNHTPNMYVIGFEDACVAIDKYLDSLKSANSSHIAETEEIQGKTPQVEEDSQSDDRTDTKEEK